MRRAAIIGITGQDGTYLARWLVQQGYEVHGLIRSPFAAEQTRLIARFGTDDVAKIHWHSGSLEDTFSLFRFLKLSQPDEIYHFAGITDSRQSFDIPEQSFTVITLGTLHLLEAAREICVQAKIFLASSCEVFGLPDQVPQNENTLKRPVTPYGIAKLAADQFAQLHRDKYGQFISVGILYNHESPLRPLNYLSSRVARAVAAIKQGRSNELQLGNLNAERDWSDARDFIRGFWLALQARTPGEYIFASGKSHRVAELVDCAFRFAGLDYRDFVKTTDNISSSQQVVAGLCGDSQKAVNDLGWKREWTFQQTIEDMVRAELEGSPQFERANPLPERKTGHQK
jgi:GDPmannose 4,6-dehydratase